MFINQNIMKKLLKTAYETTGIKMQKTIEGIAVIDANMWKMEIPEEYMNNKTKAAIIELCGELPQHQAKIYSKYATEETGEIIFENIAEQWRKSTEEYEETHLQVDTSDGTLRVLQCHDGSKLFIASSIAAMIDNTKVEVKSEETLTGDGRRVENYVIWCNNTMALKARVRGPLWSGEHRMLQKIGITDLKWEFETGEEDE